MSLHVMVVKELQFEITKARLILSKPSMPNTHTCIFHSKFHSKKRDCTDSEQNKYTHTLGERVLDSRPSGTSKYYHSLSRGSVPEHCCSVNSPNSRSLAQAALYSPSLLHQCSVFCLSLLWSGISETRHSAKNTIQSSVHEGRKGQIKSIRSKRKWSRQEELSCLGLGGAPAG